MSEGVVQQLIEHYKSTQKIRVIESLLSSIDLSVIDPLNIIKLCLQQELLNCLVYICSVKCGDFCTPIAKMLSLHVHHKEAGVKKSYGFRCLWYICLCLSGKYITQELIPVKMFRQVVVELAQLVFENPDNLLQLLWVEQRYALQVVGMFFREQPLTVLSDEALLHKKVVVISKNAGKGQNFVQEMLDQLIQCERQILFRKEILNSAEYLNEKLNQQWFYIFIAETLLLNNFAIEEKLKLETLLFILQNPYTINFLVDPDTYLNSSVDKLELVKGNQLISIVQQIREWKMPPLFEYHQNEVKSFVEIDYYTEVLNLVNGIKLFFVC